MTKQFGSKRTQMAKKVYRLRTKKLMSWVAIGEEMEITPRMANRLFQEVAGKHQQHDHLPGKGGRFPSGRYIDEDKSIVYVPVEGAYLAGDGTHNAWDKIEVPNQ